MKKPLVTIFAFFYLIISSGFTVHMHYCMGKLADWDLGHHMSKTCPKCGMKKSEEKDNGCCKDEHKFIKNNTDQKNGEAGFQLIPLIAAAFPVSFVDILSVNFPSETEDNPISHAPPRSSGVAVYIRNCVFLI